MTGRRRGIAAAATLLALLLVGPPASAQHGQAAPSAIPAASVGDEVITLGEVEQALRPQLARIEEQRHALLEARLEQLIGDRLLAQEARKRGTSVEQLLEAEVHASAREVRDAEVADFITQNRSRLPRGDEAELKLKVRDHLRGQRVTERRHAFIQSLRARNPVAIHLPVPPALRVVVSAGTGFVRGARDAPVTIVEFSDFQCPFCKTAAATVRQVLDRYPGKVRWIFRDFPIAKLHPEAPGAHEAARCAAAQGKFWEYHDLLFERSPRQARADLEQYAKDLQLDAAAFGQCLDSGQHAAAVAADVQEGTGLGVEGTPSFFINGRQLVGAQPLAAFERIIEGELAREGGPK